MVPRVETPVLAGAGGGHACLTNPLPWLLQESFLATEATLQISISGAHFSLWVVSVVHMRARRCCRGVGVRRHWFLRASAHTDVSTAVPISLSICFGGTGCFAVRCCFEGLAWAAVTTAVFLLRGRPHFAAAQLRPSRAKDVREHLFKKCEPDLASIPASIIVNSIGCAELGI